MLHRGRGGAANPTLKLLTTCKLLLLGQHHLLLLCCVGLGCLPATSGLRPFLAALFLPAWLLVACCKLQSLDIELNVMRPLAPTAAAAAAGTVVESVSWL